MCILRLYIGKKIVKEGNHQKWRIKSLAFMLQCLANPAYVLMVMTCGHQSKSQFLIVHII